MCRFEVKFWRHTQLDRGANWVSKFGNIAANLCSACKYLDKHEAKCKWLGHRATAKIHRARTKTQLTEQWLIFGKKAGVRSLALATPKNGRVHFLRHPSRHNCTSIRRCIGGEQLLTKRNTDVCLDEGGQAGQKNKLGGNTSRQRDQFGMLVRDLNARHKVECFLKDRHERPSEHDPTTEHSTSRRP